MNINHRLYWAGIMGLAVLGIVFVVPTIQAQEWDETGVDYPMPAIPDVREETPAVAKARSVARSAARAAGATEEQAEQAAFSVPEDIENRKSPHQLMLEAHAGEDPSDVEEWDPQAPVKRSVLDPRILKTAIPKAIASGKRVVGWHPYWATPTDIQNYQYSNLTTIAYFSYEVNSTNGLYDSIHSWDTTPVVEAAHDNDVKVVLTATLFGSTANQRLLTNPTACNTLVNNLLTVVEDRGGDGVCIDFEGVGSWSGATVALTSFMSNLTTTFHAADPNYEVSIALPSVDWYADFDVASYDAFGLDYAIIMGYDYYYSGSTTPGPNAPLYSSAQWIGASSWCSVDYSMDYYLGKGISTNKLMLGVPYYGRRWAASSTNLGASSLGSAYSAALTYGACESAVATYGKRWDDNASVPYYVYTDNGTAYHCFYDDTTSLGLKYDLSNTKDMGGIGIWNLAQGSEQTELWSLIDEKFGADALDPGDLGGGDTGGSSADASWTNRTSAHTANFYGVASRSGLHVASGAGGALYTSTNGIDWTVRSSGKSGLMMNVNGDGPLWVAVGQSGAIVTSTNGIDWTSRTSPTNALFRGVAYGNGTYLACGDNGALVRSTDGTTWTRVSSGTTLSLQGVGYGAEFVDAGGTNGATADSPLFVVVGASGLILTSTNATSWTSRTSGTTTWMSDVIYGNGYYVAVGNTRILRSADGITWSVATNSTYLYRAAYCSGVFKTTGRSGAIWTSSNGVTWTAETSDTTNDIRGISYANDQFVAVGFNGTLLTKGAMAGTVTDDGGETGGDGETGGGEEPVVTPDETGLPQVAAAQPTGPLSGVVVYTSGGHGFGANSALTAWVPERPLINAVNEDMGNIDQLNRFAEAAWKAGATVVPFRPVGYQTNEVVLDNMDTNMTARGQVTFGGTWYNSSQTIFYGNSGDAVPYRYAAISTNSSTSWASYRPILPASGEYPVYTWVRHGSDRVNQLYRVYHSGGVTDVRVDHSQVGCGWVWLGNYHFEAGTNGYVNIGNYTPDGVSGSYVFADAIRFGNGMGTESRGTAGLSGFESELESSRFWTIKSIGQGMSTTLYDMSGYTDREDNIGQPARMAAYMCRSDDAPRWRRVYVGFHSNAGSGSSRGAIGLYDTRLQSSYPTYYKSQTNLATSIARQCNEDMRAGVISGEIPSWSTRTSYLYGSTYGELYNSSVYTKMDTTINEVAFHDNELDCTVLKSPAGREWLARSSVRGLVQHLSGYYASGIPNTAAPDRPVNLKAVNSGSGAVTVSWAMPTRTTASGDLPQGFVLYASTDGKGFGNPISVPGAGTTTKVVTDLNAGASLFFRVCATNAGGESLNSAVAGVRVTANGAKAGVLLVDGFKRNDSSLSPTRLFPATWTTNPVALVRPRMINSFDYAKEHGLALASAGQTFDYIDSDLVTGVSVLTQYSKVVWMLGEESTEDVTFSSTEQTAVTSYLNGGGRLMVSGAEIGWDLDYRGTASDKLFFSNVLRAAYVSDGGGTGNATGTASGFLSGESMAFNYTNLLSDMYAANWPDVLSSGSGAVKATVYGTSAAGSSGAIIQYSNSTYRTIVMGFPFETITDEATRATVMASAMQFLSDTTASGAVKVTLLPAGAVSAGARWMVNGTTNISGSTRTGLNPGTYQVTFNSVAGYTTPAATSVVVVASATNLFSGTYTDSSGALTVTIAPASAVADGRWSVDGGSTWRTGGTTLSNLSNGTYAVVFKDVDNHTTPASQNVAVSGGSTATATGTYVAQVGDLTVTLSPVAARANGAAWSVDGGSTWYASGETAYNLLAGRQYYTFHSATGYALPNSIYTTVNVGTTVVRVPNSYTALPGSITVTLTPAGAVTAGAMWSLDGGTSWNESGATISDLSITTYTITFLATAGYTSPASTTHTLTAGEAASLSSAYTEILSVGADCIKSQGFDDLDVNPWNWSVAYLDNSAVPVGSAGGSGASVATNKVLFGTEALRMNGSTNGAVNPVVVLSNVDLSGYTNVTLTIPFASHGPDASDDLYVAVSSNNGTTWSPSAFGTKIADGYYTLKLDYNVTNSVERQPQGTPYVLAVPDAQTQLLVRIAFSNKPSADSTSDYYDLDEIQLTGQVGTAPVLSSALRVTLSPTAAVSAGAQWQVDGGAWRASGTVVTGLVAGAHTVSFSSAAGWVAPSAQATTTTNSTTNVVSVTYTVEPAGADCIKSQGFDGVDVNPWSWSVAYLDNSAVSVGSAGGSGAAVSTNKVLAGANAVRLWGSTNGAVNPAVVFANVDLSGYTNVSLTVPFASDGPDASDDLYVAVSTNGGATWSPSAFGAKIADGYSGLKLDYNVTNSVDRQPKGTPYVLAVADSANQLIVRVAFSNKPSADSTIDSYYLDEIQLTGQAGTAPVLSSALCVTLSPAAAVSAGAQWRVDAGAWRASGAIATGLTAGAHTVSFSAISGWTEPSDISTATTNGTTNAFSATYAEVSSGPVTLIDEPFDDANITLPADWEFSGTAWYTSASYCGAAAPSVKFDTDGDYLVTPSFIGGTNLSFVIRGNTTSVTGAFVIAQYISGSWSTLVEITEWSTSKTTNSYAMSPSASKLSFTWMRTNGYVAFDDVKVVGIEIEAALDTDGDGIPDDYETTHFGGSTNANPDADSDNDGTSNLSEYIAGTDPQANASVLAVAAMSANTNTSTLTFSWPSVTGRVYSIWQATNAGGSYTPYVTNLSASTPTNTRSVSAPAAAGTYYYGVRVTWPDAP